MLSPPADAMPLYVGLAVAGAAFLGIALDAPNTPRPDAAGAAETIDRVAASPQYARDTRRLDATEIRLGPHRIALRNDAGTARASMRFGPVVPVRDGTKLAAILDGRPASRVFSGIERFRAAVRDALERDGGWRTVDGPLRTIHVTWGGRDVTLVGT